MLKPMLCAATAAMLLAAGCGADEAPKAAAANPTPAGAQFVAEAEAICKDANAKEAAAGATGIDWIYSELYTDRGFLKEFTGVGRTALGRLRALTPPPEDRAQFETSLDAIEQMLGALEEQMAGLRRGREPKDALARYEHGYTDLVAAGGPIGFTECLGLVL